VSTEVARKRGPCYFVGHEEILDDRSQIGTFVHNENAWHAQTLPNPIKSTIGHCLPVVSQQNAPLFGRPCQDYRVFGRA
jgi:hypothetical protein